MARVDLGGLRQLGQSPKGGVHALGSLAAVDREVGPGRIADQQRVAGQQVPVGQVAAVLRPVARGVDDADRDVADPQLVAVLDRVERVRRLGQRVDADRQPVLEREPPVPGEMVGVGVRLEHADDADAETLRLLEIGLDRVGRVDDHRLAARLVADQVGRAAEILVDALEEDHCRATVPTAPASFLEVRRPATSRVSTGPTSRLSSPSRRTRRTSDLQPSRRDHDPGRWRCRRSCRLDAGAGMREAHAWRPASWYGRGEW